MMIARSIKALKEGRQEVHWINVKDIKEKSFSL